MALLSAIDHNLAKYILGCVYLPKLTTVITHHRNERAMDFALRIDYPAYRSYTLVQLATVQRYHKPLPTTDWKLLFEDMAAHKDVRTGFGSLFDIFIQFTADSMLIRTISSGRTNDTDIYLPIELEPELRQHLMELQDYARKLNDED